MMMTAQGAEGLRVLLHDLGERQLATKIPQLDADSSFVHFAHLAASGDVLPGWYRRAWRQCVDRLQRQAA